MYDLRNVSSVIFIYHYAQSPPVQANVLKELLSSRPNRDNMLNQPFIQELKHEAASTKKILERIPQDKFDWKPHENQGHWASWPPT
jgi:hypothetical protein